MAIIAQTTTDTSETSSAAAPTGVTSELVISGDWTSGTVSLQSRNPKENTEFVTILVVTASPSGTKSVNKVVLTPDVAVLYRAVAAAIVGTVNINFGP